MIPSTRLSRNEPIHPIAPPRWWQGRAAAARAIVEAEFARRACEYTERDRALREAFDEAVAEWCATHHFLVPTGTGYVVRLPDAKNTIQHTLYMTNFRILTREAELVRFAEAITDTEFDFTTNELINFAVRLSAQLGMEFIDRYINQLYRALHAVADPEADLSWSTVHARFPFFWLLFAVQAMMLRFTPPPPLR